MNLPHIKMVLGLSDYHIRNLRWLLRMAYTHEKSAEGRQAVCLDTGDWCGELLWEIEQFMKDHGIDTRANTHPDWPLTGWHGTAFGIQSDRTFFAATLQQLDDALHDFIGGGI